MTWLYQPGRALANFCFRVFGRLEVTGQECVPPYGPLIVAVNHVSYNDPPALVLSLPRPLDFMGKKELFENVISRFLMNQFRVHPLDRSATGLDAIRTAMDLLAQDRAVVLFPEGHISPGARAAAGEVGGGLSGHQDAGPDFAGGNLWDGEVFAAEDGVSDVPVPRQYWGAVYAADAGGAGAAGGGRQHYGHDNGPDCGVAAGGVPGGVCLRWWGQGWGEDFPRPLNGVWI